MKSAYLRKFFSAVILLAAACSCAWAQSESTPPQTTAPAPPSTYQPKFPGDPAHSDSEAVALAYMRTVIRAQKLYYKKNDDKYAASLTDLVHTGNFTRRMVNPDRGDYTAKFHAKKDGYEITMIPKQQDASHRAFYANDDGVIRADENKTADESSPKLK